jgi:RNA polymerase sigma-70 factor (ECF subfamily)
MSRFDTTQWTLVLRARGQGEAARAALEALCRTYRPPVYAYIRRNGYARDAAEDLTQAFFASFLERASYESAEPGLGRFRNFLLTAVERFLLNEDRAGRTVKRGGRVQVRSLDARDAAVADEETPERAFERAWAFVVLDNALRRLRAEADEAGKREQFDRLCKFLVEPPDRTEYARIAAELGLRSNTLAVTVHRLRERLRVFVREALTETTANAAALETELQELGSALGVAYEGAHG